MGGQQTTGPIVPAATLGGSGGLPKPPDSMSAASPQDPYSWAMQEANRRYPRIAKYNMDLTYNPRREGYSETYPPKGEDAKYPGRWTVEMGESSYYYKPQSWPELIGLEGLHPLQAEDPKFQQMTAQLKASLTPEQLAQAHQAYEYSKHDKDYGPYEGTFDQYLTIVHIPEFIRGRMFGPLFQQVEGSTGGDRYNMTPEQQKMVDQIAQYMRTSNGGR